MCDSGMGSIVENFVMVKIKTLKDLHKDADLFIFFSENAANCVFWTLYFPHGILI